jgi:hypothetical protein
LTIDWTQYRERDCDLLYRERERVKERETYSH